MYFAFLHFYNSSTLILAILGLAPALWSYIEEPDNPLVVVYCTCGGKEQEGPASVLMHRGTLSL